MPPDIQQPKPPETGHDTARAGLGFGVNKSFSFEEFSWRPTLQDLPASDDGYTPDSQLEMLNTRLRVDNVSRRPYIERLDLADIIALSPWDDWVRKPSWRFLPESTRPRNWAATAPPACITTLEAAPAYPPRLTLAAVSFITSWPKRTSARDRSSIRVGARERAGRRA